MVLALEQSIDFHWKFVKVVGRRLDGHAAVVRVRLGEHGALGAPQAEKGLRRHTVVVWRQAPAPPLGHAAIETEAPPLWIRILGLRVKARDVAVVIEGGLAGCLAAILCCKKILAFYRSN